MLVAGALIVAFFVVVAAFADQIAPYGFNTDRENGKVFGRLVHPSAAHTGHDRRGARTSSRASSSAPARRIEVIVLAVAFSIVIGVVLGLVSGYFGGLLDRLLVLVTDALFAFPSLLLAIIVSIAIAGGSSSQAGGILSAAISITVVYVPQYFRVVRNATVAAREEPFVEAARSLARRRWRS